MMVTAAATTMTATMMVAVVSSAYEQCNYDGE